MTYGGVVVQNSKPIIRTSVNQVAQLFVGLVLFALVTGLWAYLWVSSPPVF